jgi:hypothetical protein
MECKYGCHLTHGPPIEQGFFYDCYMGDNVVSDKVNKHTNIHKYNILYTSLTY